LDAWNSSGHRVVEEVDSDDSDTHHGGSSRFISDPLHFTGIDLGEGQARQRRSFVPPPSTEGDSTSEEESEDESDAGADNGAQIAMRDKEEALVESALARIQRAQAKGKDEVKLTREELGALERRRERQQEEEKRRRRREREQRFAIPLSQLAPTSRKKVGSGDDGRRRSNPGTSDEAVDRQGYPPIGFFPPPNSRPRSGTASRPSSGVASRDRGDRGGSPFNYAYVNQPPSNSRHVSDTSARPRSARNSIQRESDLGSHPTASASDPSLHTDRGLDPFQYMTAGPRAPYHGGAAAARRHASGPPGGDAGYRGDPRGPGASAAVRGGGSDDTTSETESENDSESSSDELGHGAPIRPNGASAREAIIVEEVRRTPDPEPERSRRSSKKPSASSSPSKRKPVGSGSGNRRRKGR
jgi:PRA1 family protein 1